MRGVCSHTEQVVARRSRMDYLQVTLVTHTKSGTVSELVLGHIKLLSRTLRSEHPEHQQRSRGDSVVLCVI